MLSNMYRYVCFDLPVPLLVWWRLPRIASSMFLVPWNTTLNLKVESQPSPSICSLQLTEKAVLQEHWRRYWKLLA